MTTWSVPDSVEGYQILQELGEGYTGQVYLGRDVLLKRNVAVKFMRSERDSVYQCRQFIREAQLMARVQHSNVVALYNVGQHQGVPYIVLEYVSGGPLSAIEEQIPIKDAIIVVLGVLQGLMASHQQGIVHGDIKPSNILLTQESVPKIIDFGLAVEYLSSTPVDGQDGLSVGVEPGSEMLSFLEELEVHTETTSDVEVTADMLFDNEYRPIEGTPDYMAPELWRGDFPTPQSDCYAVGVVLYKLIEGCTPFEHVMANDLATAVQCIDAPASTTAPPELAAIIARSLARKPSDRWGSAEDMYSALEGLVGKESLLDTIVAQTKWLPLQLLSKLKIDMTNEDGGGLLTRLRRAISR